MIVLVRKRSRADVRKGRPTIQQNEPPLLQVDDNGLYCSRGDFYVDPWRPVRRAVVTHGHSDHARPGSRAYLCSETSRDIIALRLGRDARIETVAFGDTTTINGVRVSLHPAGHILGSAQVRVEFGGETWVVTGDYKTQPDPSAESFELVRCDTLVTECTFGLPIYRWPPQQEVFREINEWWSDNRSRDVTTVLLGYSLGKAQRLIAGLDASIGPIYTHGAVERMNGVYRSADRLPVKTTHVSAASPEAWSDGIVIAPPGAAGTTWLRRFGNASLGFASGWMTVRGRRKQRGADRGFVLSDHVDWPELLRVVEATGCRRVLATHGYTEEVSRWFNDQGLDAAPLRTRYTGEEGAEEATQDAGDEQSAQETGGEASAGGQRAEGNHEPGTGGRDA